MLHILLAASCHEPRERHRQHRWGVFWIVAPGTRVRRKFASIPVGGVGERVFFHVIVDKLGLRAVIVAPPTQVFGAALRVEVLAPPSEFEHRQAHDRPTGSLPRGLQAGERVFIPHGRGWTTGDRRSTVGAIGGYLSCSTFLGCSKVGRSAPGATGGRVSQDNAPEKLVADLICRLCSV